MGGYQGVEDSYFYPSRVFSEELPYFSCYVVVLEGKGLSFSMDRRVGCGEVYEAAVTRMTELELLLYCCYKCVDGIVCLSAGAGTLLGGCEGVV